MIHRFTAVTDFVVSYYH